MLIEVTVSTNKVGSSSTKQFEVDDEADYEEIEAQARELMFDMIEWDWQTVDRGGVNMYNKELETDKQASQQYVSNQKKASAERLAKNAAWNKAHKPKQDK